MRIVSFAWTTPALLAGAKTVTRREWTLGYANRFRKGDLVAAYDRSPRYKGKQVATLRLTDRPARERYCDVTDDDWEAEGFAWLEENGHTMPHGRRRVKPSVLFRAWRYDKQPAWVVRFEVVSVEGRRPIE